MITSSSSGEYAFKKVFLLASKWVQETESILSTFCPPRARNALLFRVARNKRVFALVRDTSKAQFVTRSHSNSESHARARPKRESLPNEASVVMMRRVRVGFLYVTLRLNAAAFSKSVRFLFSLVLFFVLIYLYSLHLSSRPRTFLIGAPAQESISKVHFCASFALGRPRERKKSLVLIAVKHTKSSQDSFSSFLSFFLRFASSIGGTNLEPISGTFSTIGTFSQTKCISFFPYLDTESKRNGRRDSSGTQHPPIHITVIVLRTLRRVFFFGFAGFCATGKFLFCAGKIQISSSWRKRALCCVL